jgi:hypothetical protein
MLFKLFAIAGIASPTAPIYISEISSPDYRGTFGCFPALLLAVGTTLNIVFARSKDTAILNIVFLTSLFPLHPDVK